MSTLLQVLDSRLRSLLTRLAAGDDLTPGAVLRLEGMCDAVVLGDLCSEGDIDHLIDALHEEILGESLRNRLGADWRVYHPFPELPLFMQRAPVSPSTRP